MIVLLCISFGFGLACIAGIVWSILYLVKACNELPEHAKIARLLGLVCTIGATASGLFWAWHILVSAQQLVFKSGGPGPFGLLAFPLWAAIAVIPALIAALIFKWIASRLKAGQ